MLSGRRKRRSHLFQKDGGNGWRSLLPPLAAMMVLFALFSCKSAVTDKVNLWGKLGDMRVSAWERRVSFWERSARNQRDGADDKDGIGEGASEKKIALTFDDGPHPVYTERLLKGLKERDVKATFFVLGEKARAYPEMIARMEAEGHIVGNHTYTHIQLRSGNRQQFREELLMTNEVLSGITGKEVQYVRPPYGTWDKKLEEELNMFPVLWNIDPNDWCTGNADKVTKRIVAKARENGIILLHDCYKSSVEAALATIDLLKEQGFEFVTVEEILFD